MIIKNFKKRNYRKLSRPSVMMRSALTRIKEIEEIRDFTFQISEMKIKG